MRIDQNTRRFLALIALCSFSCERESIGAEQFVPSNMTGTMIVKEGSVQFRSSGTNEMPARPPQPLGFGEGLHTLQLAGATVEFLDFSEMQMKELTVLEVKPRLGESDPPRLKVNEGQIYFSNRKSGPRTIEVESPHARAVPEGTEFLVSVDRGANRTEITMFDGRAKVQGANDLTPVLVTNGAQAITIAGQPTIVQSIVQATNIVQWWIFYPGVLEPDEIGLSPSEQTLLVASLAGYRDGDPKLALTKYPGYPAPAEPATDPQRIYLAGTLLAVGAVDRATALLTKVNSNLPPAHALWIMIHAVTVDFRKMFSTNAGPEVIWGPAPATASEWLALSYAHQATNNLKAALQSARKAVEQSPKFGFGWVRIGELEFSFGHTRAAREAVQKAMLTSPRNAQAHALNGFLLAAENRTHEAIAAFDKAIEIDSALGNAWLGRGLCKRRLTWFSHSRIANQDSNAAPDWLRDLQTAAILEPTRSLVRSYAGKAFGDAGDERLAHKEFDYASKLDPNDPTPWLYSALLKQQENRINEAVSDLQDSQERNDNRSLFRSRLLLDEDRAVRSANLAAIYRDAGLTDFSVREASRAVTADYGNYSAHLFLANSYNQLRDPALVNLRYETATFSEYLVANLLSPVGGSALSPYVSQQEYSRLFEQNRVGLSSETDYSSRGDWQQQASQFGWFKDSSFAVDVFYRSLNGQRTNNDLEQRAYSLQFKQQLTGKDSVYVQAVFNKYESGDVSQYYDPGQASPSLRIKEEQEPNLFLGYHHEWSPGNHTLFLGGRLQDKFQLSNSGAIIRGVELDAAGLVTNTAQAVCQILVDHTNLPPDFDISLCDSYDSLRFESDFQAWTAELQQITQVSHHTLIFGGRFQDGDIETRAMEERRIFPPSEFKSTQNVRSDLTRLSLYGYDQWQLLDTVWLTGGLSYDQLRYPRNNDAPPVSAETDTTDQISPKAGLIWQPGSSTTMRAAYTRSLGGVFYDGSVRLEPTQVAGFNQAYRSLIPESIAGNIPGSRFETADLGLEHRFASGIFFVLGAEALRSEATRDIGAFQQRFPPELPIGLPVQLTQNLEFEEHSLVASLNQLMGREWAFGARYQISEAQLKTKFPSVPTALIPPTDNRSLLHRLNLFALYNHPSGCFGEAQALWTAQSNHGYSPTLAGDDFWQLNILAGYRFPRRQAQVTIGVLNLTDQGYHLNPLNLHAELPYQRTVTASLRFSF